MVPVVQHPSSLLIRWVHVLGMALLLGGAALTWGAFRLDRAGGSGDVAGSPAGDLSLRVAEVYEWLFWAGAGLLVLTGVGNLGALAPTVPGLDTGWGMSFAVKLAAVLGLLAASPVRTLSVVRLAAANGVPHPAAVSRLRLAYASTAVYLLLVLGIAEVLAHG